MSFNGFFNYLFFLFVCCGLFTLIDRCVNTRIKAVRTGIFILFLIPGYMSFQNENAPDLGRAGGSYQPAEYIEWIRSHTDKNDVFLVSNPHMAFYEVQPYTARKIVASERGHMNFHVDFDKRVKDKSRMITSDGLDEFHQTASFYEVKYSIINRGDVSETRFLFFRNNFPLVFEHGNFIIVKSDIMNIRK
ncbi:MAG: hypothetical protein JW881_06375 [Spirochaetales bacterium]|nr:hypothetical protein [Spirochaetales bacterium]